MSNSNTLQAPTRAKSFDEKFSGRELRTASTELSILRVTDAIPTYRGVDTDIKNMITFPPPRTAYRYPTFYTKKDSHPVNYLFADTTIGGEYIALETVYFVQRSSVERERLRDYVELWHNKLHKILPVIIFTNPTDTLRQQFRAELESIGAVFLELPIRTPEWKPKPAAVQVALDFQLAKLENLGRVEAGNPENMVNTMALSNRFRDNRRLIEEVRS